MPIGNNLHIDKKPNKHTHSLPNNHLILIINIKWLPCCYTILPTKIPSTKTDYMQMMVLEK